MRAIVHARLIMPCNYFGLGAGEYDTGAVRTKKQDDNAKNGSGRTTVALLIPATSQSVPLLRELDSLFNVSFKR